MSKSLKRVRATLEASRVEFEILEMVGETRTAAAAAHEASCEIDQIAKSIIFRGEVSGQPVLFITAGGNQVCPEKATELAGEPLARADASFVRQKTGFAIGGVAPIGHLTESRIFYDPRLSDFDAVYAAAGTPRHIFRIAPNDLRQISRSQVSEFIL